MTRTVTFEEAIELTGVLRHWAYNAADTTGTRTIHNVLWPRVQRAPRKLIVYNTQMAFQNPAFAITRRGILIDQPRREAVLEHLGAEIEAALAAVDAHPLVRALWDGKEKETGTCPKSKRKDGKHTWSKEFSDECDRICEMCSSPRFVPSPFNANSSAQVYHLLIDLVGIPPQKNKKGDLSADVEVLMRLRERAPGGTPREVRKRWADISDIIGYETDDALGVEGRGILHVRSLAKQRGEVAAPLSLAGRYMSTAQIGATWTGRSSSAKAPDNLGGNTQNKAQRIRPMFRADPGYEFGNFDLMRAESMVVAYLADDPAYIEAHHTDTHTFVARLLWPDMPWTGDIKRDAALAKASTPPWDTAPGHDWRFQAKRVQHGSNYGLTPRGISMLAHIPLAAAEEAQGRYFDAFPGIRNVYQYNIIDRIRAGLPLVSPLGREIPLLGRPWDRATHRQGFSAIPQGFVADVVWMACYLIYKDLDPHMVQLLQNGFDSMLCQWRPKDREIAIREIVARMTIPIKMPSGKTLTIPVEGAAGANWGKRSKDNPNGLEDVYP